MRPIKKELLVTSQSLKFSQRPQVDPEGQSAVREFTVQSPAGYQQSGAGGVVDQQGNIPAIVQYGSTAGEMANARRTSCAGCKNWDNKALRQFISDATGPLANPAWKQTIESMKTRIDAAGYGYERRDGSGVVDLDVTLNAHGICRPMSDWVEGVTGRDPVFWPVVTWREATCPRSCRAGAHELPVVTTQQPLGLFVPVDLDAEKIGAKRYDEVLRAAQGKS
jgi:hypothetical protein